MQNTSSSSASANHVRWITYITLDRQVLWSETRRHDPEILRGRPLPPYQDQVPEVSMWHDLVDAAFATRLPQKTNRTVSLNNRQQAFTISVFPEFGIGGALKGVIQIVEQHIPCLPGEVVSYHSSTLYSFIDLVGCGVVFYDPEKDRIHMANSMTSRHMGYSLSELDGMAGHVLFGDDGVLLLRDLFNRMMTAGDSMLWWQMFPMKDRNNYGGIYLSLARIITVSDLSPSPLMLISCDFNAMEMELITRMMDSGPKFSFVLEALQEGLWEFDFNRNVLFYGQSFADILGPEGLPGGPGKPIADWIASVDPHESETAVLSWRRLMKRGEFSRISYRLRDKKGQWRWILSTIHAILNKEDGSPLRLFGYLIEVSDAIQTESRLIDAEERLRVIFQNAGTGIAIINADGTLDQVNPALAAMMGRVPEDLEKKQLADIAHPDYRKLLERMFERLMETKRRESIEECMFLRPDGQAVWVKLSATLSHRVSDSVRYIVITLEDITLDRDRRAKLFYEATHDMMTGTWNHTVLLEQLTFHLGLALRYHHSMSFALCDLDSLTWINQKYGHHVGNQVLIRFVAILQASLLDTDFIGRYGGEDVGIIFPYTHPETAGKRLERALSFFLEESFTGPEGDSFTVTATVGISGVTDNCDTKQMIDEASRALYNGKKSGRNQVIIADPENGKWY